MKLTIAAVLTGVAAAATSLDPNWSFSSTSVIPDESTTWYTVTAPFLTTITTSEWGIITTVTTTKISVSMGTEPPSTTAPAIPTGHFFCNASAMANVVARSLATSTTDELITRTHSNPQSHTIDDGDVLPTTSLCYETTSTSTSLASSTASYGGITTASPTSMMTSSAMNSTTDRCEETSTSSTFILSSTAQPVNTTMTSPSPTGHQQSSASLSTSSCDEESSSSTTTVSMSVSEVPTTLVTATSLITITFGTTKVTSVSSASGYGSSTADAATGTSSSGNLTSAMSSSSSCEEKPTTFILSTQATNSSSATTDDTTCTETQSGTSHTTESIVSPYHGSVHLGHPTKGQPTLLRAH